MNELFTFSKFIAWITFFPFGCFCLQAFSTIALTFFAFSTIPAIEVLFPLGRKKWRKNAQRSFLVQKILIDLLFFMVCFLMTFLDYAYLGSQVLITYHFSCAFFNWRFFVWTIPRIDVTRRLVHYRVLPHFSLMFFFLITRVRCIIFSSLSFFLGRIRGFAFHHCNTAFW